MDAAVFGLLAVLLYVVIVAVACDVFSHDRREK